MIHVPLDFSRSLPGEIQGDFSWIRSSLESSKKSVRATIPRIALFATCTNSTEKSQSKQRGIWREGR